MNAPRRRATYWTAARLCEHPRKVLADRSRGSGRVEPLRQKGSNVLWTACRMLFRAELCALERSTGASGVSASYSVVGMVGSWWMNSAAIW